MIPEKTPTGEGESGGRRPREPRAKSGDLLSYCACPPFHHSAGGTACRRAWQDHTGVGASQGSWPSHRSNPSFPCSPHFQFRTSQIMSPNQSGGTPPLPSGHLHHLLDLQHLPLWVCGSHLEADSQAWIKGLCVLTDWWGEVFIYFCRHHSFHNRLRTYSLPTSSQALSREG